MHNPEFLFSRAHNQTLPPAAAEYLHRKHSRPQYWCLTKWPLSILMLLLSFHQSEQEKQWNQQNRDFSSHVMSVALQQLPTLGFRQFCVKTLWDTDTARLACQQHLTHAIPQERPLLCLENQQPGLSTMIVWHCIFTILPLCFPLWTCGTQQPFILGSYGLQEAAQCDPFRVKERTRSRRLSQGSSSNLKVDSTIVKQLKSWTKHQVTTMTLKKPQRHPG